MNYNIIMVALLRSPLHRIMSGSFMLITYTGRKSGKSITLPVNYLKVGDKILVVSLKTRTWWRNLRGGARVGLRIQGKDRKAQAEALETLPAVVNALQGYFQAAPKMARYFEVQLSPDGLPIPEDVAKAAAERVVVQIGLEE